MSSEDIKAKYASQAIERSGCWLLDAKTTLEFLSDLQAAAVPLSGIEGYWLQEGVLEPSLENSVYFLGSDIRIASLEGGDAIEKAKNFVRTRMGSGLLFDLDLGDN